MRLAPGAKTEITYPVDRAGRIHTEVVYHGAKGLPELPEFGLRLLMPGKAESYTWEGLSGETYPDRKKGGTFGVHTGTPEAAHYLVPQECGNHADTCQAQIGDLRIVPCFRTHRRSWKMQRTAMNCRIPAAP